MLAPSNERQRQRQKGSDRDGGRGVWRTWAGYRFRGLGLGWARQHPEIAKQKGHQNSIHIEYPWKLFPFFGLFFL